MKVRVKSGKWGYLNHERKYGAGIKNRKSGDVFEVSDKEFSSKWMEEIKADEPDEEEKRRVGRPRKE
ncbi:MAG TPA: hypothetical protein VI387_00785 [Candidatus Brocadiales bacterium]|nr:hypothetical protein [Candidatus Brocadiales bacterium]